MSKKKKQNGEGEAVAVPQNQATGNTQNPSTSDETVVLSSPSVSCTLGEADSDMDPQVHGNEVEQIVQEKQNKQSAGQVLDKRPQRKTGDGKQKTGAKPASGQQRSYKSFFTDNRDAPTKIRLEDFRKYKTADRKVKLGTDVVDDHELTVGHYLIGYVAGKFPGKGIIAKCCNSWKVPCSLKFHASEWLIFKFDKLEDRNKVIEGGPYYIYGRPLLLKTMPDCFNFTDDEIGKVPVWVQFPNLPLQLWNAGALSMIASQFGKPMYTDGLTGTKGRIDYARVLIEVDVAVEPIESVTIELPNGSSFEQKAYYEFMPKFCRKCRAIGHLEDKCPYYKSVSAENSKVSKPSSDTDGAALNVQQQGNKQISSSEKGRLNSDTGDVATSMPGSGDKILQGQNVHTGTDVQHKSASGDKPGASSGGGSGNLSQPDPQFAEKNTVKTVQGQGSGGSKGLNCDKPTEQTTDNAAGTNIAGTDESLCRDQQVQHDTRTGRRVQTEAGKQQNSAAQCGTDAGDGTADINGTDTGDGTADHNCQPDVENSAAVAQGQRQVPLDETAGKAELLDSGPGANTEAIKTTASGMADDAAADDAGFTVVKRKNKQSKASKQQNKNSQEGNVQSALQSKPKGSKVKEQKTSKLDKGKGLAPAYAS